VEKKYLLTKEQYNQLLNRIEPFMLRDKYGLHTICNIYFDTDNYDLIRISSERPIYKEKLRLRSYGIPSEEDTVFLEIKKKYKGTVYKRRISLRLKDAVNYLEHGIKPCCDNQILHEIDYFIDYYKPSGKVFIAYDRTAFYGREDASIRITFDQNIRSRTYDLDLSKGDYGQPLIQTPYYLMEIKVPLAMPLWLVHIMSDLNIYPVSFSKYGNIYKQELIQLSAYPHAIYQDILMS
jgi:hypothetical protein